MKVEKHKYAALPDYNRTDGYTPGYVMLICSAREDYLIHAIKVRKDIWIDSLINPKLEELLPASALLEDGPKVFAYTTYDNGEIGEFCGFLYVEEKKVVGLINCPLKAMGYKDSNVPEHQLFIWKGGSAEYTLLDYEEGEVEKCISEGMERYREYWNRYNQGKK